MIQHDAQRKQVAARVASDVLHLLGGNVGACAHRKRELFFQQVRQTLVVATHRVAVLGIVDRLIVMDGGRIVADGPRDEILAKAAL